MWIVSFFEPDFRKLLYDDFLISSSLSTFDSIFNLSTFKLAVFVVTAEPDIFKLLAVVFKFSALTTEPRFLSNP